MSKTAAFGFVDTAIDGVSTLPFARGLLNFVEDFDVLGASNGKEVVLTNLTCPLDLPENIRIAHSNVANIYNGTQVERSYMAPSTRGVSILVQCTDVQKVTDSEDSSYRIDLPYSAHLVLKGPATEYFTPTVVETMVGRLLSCLYNTGSTEPARLQAILRGSIVPSEV